MPSLPGVGQQQSGANQTADYRDYRFRCVGAVGDGNVGSIPNRAAAWPPTALQRVRPRDPAITGASDRHRGRRSAPLELLHDARPELCAPFRVKCYAVACNRRVQRRAVLPPR